MQPEGRIDNCAEIEVVTRMAHEQPDTVSEQDAEYLFRLENTLKKFSDE